MEFDAMSDAELLRTYCRSLHLIRQRKLHLPGGNPTAGYAELLAEERLGLQLNPPETKGSDARDSAARYSYEIKHSFAPQGQPQTGSIKNLENRPFDFLVYLIFNDDLSVREAWKLSHDAVLRHAYYNKSNQAPFLKLTNDVRADAEDISHMFG